MFIMRAVEHFLCCRSVLRILETKTSLRYKLMGSQLYVVADEPRKKAENEREGNTERRGMQESESYEK